MSEIGRNTYEALLNAARNAQWHAYAPYSHLSFGAAVLTDREEIVAGCNVENASYGLTICAERTAISAAVAAGATRILAMVLVHSVHGSQHDVTPCGACRQVLAEFATADTSVIVVTGEEQRIYRLDTLLPHAFRLADR